MAGNFGITDCVDIWIPELQSVNGLLEFLTTNHTSCYTEPSYTMSYSRIFYAYSTPVVLAVGIIGNILSLIVFLSRNMRKLSASTYLAALSISDTCALVFYVFIDWLRRGLPYIPGNIEPSFLEEQGLCQIQIYLSYVSRFISAWIIAIFTIERYISVCYPLKRKHISGNKFPSTVIVILAVISCIIMVYKPILTGRYEYTMKHRTVARCARDPNFPLLSFVLDSIFAVSITLIPFLLIAVLNTLSIRRLYIRNKRKINRVILTEESVIRMEFTIILLVVSFVFVALNLPYFYFWCKRFLHVFQTTAPSGNRTDFLDQSESDLLIARVVFYLNYCVNFFLYSVTGAYFRKEIVMLFWGRNAAHHNYEYRLSCHSNRSTPQSWV